MRTSTFATISSADLDTVTGGARLRLLKSREPQRDTRGAIEGGQRILRFDNYDCNGAICGGKRLRLFR